MALRASDLERFRDQTVPDLLPERLRLLFVGINPGLWTAATGAHFARPGNRFYPALVAAGILPHLPRITEDGMSAADRDLLLQRGIGITNLVRRATARADELSREELRAGASALTVLVGEQHPPVVAVVGLTAYRQGFDRPRAVSGEQTELLAGARLWVVPNPSGLNAHDTVESLARAYADPARAAGVIG
ncbi:TDG/mug DNA glycosylase family protein [Microbacterium sp. AK009]|uniref:mismatch-specific DNA-glycosylase n=1 Tax=Microbacterium sp. AK009 TaxID=2723068 RepID=UPI0015C9373E|nr:mismatch-specific DNA-glycosylase [Microbacterium sp. AK009]NYF16357.1 TDG/mug DNA glycosylase family protein [Microbacterium sp. AK009]